MARAARTASFGQHPALEPEAQVSDPKPTILDRVLDRPGLRLILWVAICHAFLQSATMQPNRVGTYHDAHYFCLHEEAARITILEHGQVPVWNPWFCGGIPGITVLSRAGVPSSFVRPRDSVVRKPAVAGPKPTQTMSTSIVWRSTSGMCCSTEDIVIPWV